MKLPTPADLILLGAVLGFIPSFFIGAFVGQWLLRQAQRRGDLP